MPKIKPPGIGIDIQGRDPEKYKIRRLTNRTYNIRIIKIKKN